MPPQAEVAVGQLRAADSMNQNRKKSTDGLKIKCVLVGDGAVGKTSLIVSYSTNGFPTEYIPTAYDKYAVSVTVNNEPVGLQLCDTAGQDDFDLLRPLCYPESDVFLLCFSIACPTSFHNISEKWLPEIRAHGGSSTPIILVGTQEDLRNDVKVLIDLANYGERPITEVEGRSLARSINAVSYLECSALTQKNLKEVFDLVILTCLNRQDSCRMNGCSKPQQMSLYRQLSNGQLNDSPLQSLKRKNSRSGSRPSRWKQLLCCFL